MPEDKPLKSAYELAMERLKAKDREQGIEDEKPLTDRQKREIARLRQETKAKLAEIEILYRERVQKAPPEEAAKLREIEEEYRRERARAEERLEAAIARLRQKKQGSGLA